MLGRLLDFTRPDELHCTACDLRAEAEEVADFVRAEDAPGAAVVVDVPGAARSVQADRDKLKQVLLNLVKNGVEALQGPGTVTVRAEPVVQDGERLVRVCVADTGRGIPPEEIGRVLEPFYSNKAGGTGLGLPIVQRILQLHGSKLNIESCPGSGTSMSFLLRAGGTEES